MERRILLGVLGATLMALAAAILLPGGRPVDPSPKLPWQIDVDSDGTARVFGLKLAQSPLREAQELFDEAGKINLFRVDERHLAVEAFFEQVYLSGLRGDFVLSLDVPSETAQAMFERGLRTSKASSGDRKVTLSPEDFLEVADAPIKQISYLPAAKLDPDLIAQRFGEPSERVAEPGSGIVHWLYPERGLDIATDANGRAVLQYVAPETFERVRAPLQAAQEAGPSNPEVRRP